MKKFALSIALLVLALTLVCSAYAEAPAFVADEGVLNPDNYKLYGNGDEYATFDPETGAINVMAHTAYKNGFKIDENTELKITLSVNSTYGHWLGIGFLSAPNYGAPATADDGVMLYMTTISDNSVHDFRIFQMNAPFQELKRFLTEVPVGEKFTLTLKYDAEKAGWFYWVNDAQVYSEQNYYEGEAFIDPNGMTYLCFAYENNGQSTPITIYSVESNYVAK